MEIIVITKYNIRIWKLNKFQREKCASKSNHVSFEEEPKIEHENMFFSSLISLLKIINISENQMTLHLSSLLWLELLECFNDSLDLFNWTEASDDVEDLWTGADVLSCSLDEELDVLRSMTRLKLRFLSLSVSFSTRVRLSSLSSLSSVTTSILFFLTNLGVVLEILGWTAGAGMMLGLMLLLLLLLLLLRG